VAREEGWEEKSAVTQSSQTRWVQSAENRGRGEKRSRLVEIDVARRRDALWNERGVRGRLARFFFYRGRV